MATSHATPDKGVQKRPSRRDGSTRGLTAASACAKSALRTAAGRRGIAEARLITHWAEIAGDSLASATRPIRVKPPRGVALGGVLVLAVDGARASEVEHAIPRVIERVNAHYGYGAIAEVKLTQSAAGPIATPKPKRPKAIRPEDLPAEKREALDAMTKPIESEALRDALQRLGANVMNRSAEKKPSKSAGRGVVRSLASGKPAPHEA